MLFNVILIVCDNFVEVCDFYLNRNFYSDLFRVLKAGIWWYIYIFWQILEKPHMIKTKQNYPYNLSHSQALFILGSKNYGDNKWKVVNLCGLSYCGQFLHHSNSIEIADAARIPAFFWKPAKAALESIGRCNIKFEKWSNIQQNRSHISWISLSFKPNRKQDTCPPTVFFIKVWKFTRKVMSLELCSKEVYTK